MLKKFKWPLLILTIICLTLPYLVQATVSNTTTRIKYPGSGNQTIFPYPFKIWATSDLVVVLTKSTGDVTQTLNTDYTVSGVGNEAGGNVTMVTAPASDEYLTILRQLPLKQETDYIEGDPFPAQSHENSLDKLVMIGQQLNEQLARTPQLPKSTSLNNITFPTPSGSEPQYLRWGAGTNQLEAVATGLTGTIESGVIHAVNYGEPGQAAIEAALTAIDSDNRTLKLTAGTWGIVSDLSIPPNINLRIERGAVLDIANGKTLTINGTLEAGLYQILSWTGSGKVVFGKGVAGIGYPEWWGAKGDYNGSTGTDDTAAVQACWNSGVRNIKMLKWYKVTGLTINKCIHVQGVMDNLKKHGIYGTGIPADNYTKGYQPANTNLVVIQNGIKTTEDHQNYSVLEDLVVQGAAGTVTFLQQYGNADGYYSERILHRNCYFVGGAIGAQIETSNLGFYENTRYGGSTYGLWIVCRNSPTTRGAFQKNTLSGIGCETPGQAAGTALKMQCVDVWDIQGNVFTGLSAEEAFNCIEYKGTANTFIGAHTERYDGTYLVVASGSSATWINCYDQYLNWYTNIGDSCLNIEGNNMFAKSSGFKSTVLNGGPFIIKSYGSPDVPRIWLRSGTADQPDNGGLWINEIVDQGRPGDGSGTESGFYIYLDGLNNLLKLEARLVGMVKGGLQINRETGEVIITNPPKFAGDNNTGSGSAALGNNCPAVTASAPYTWLKAIAADGSTVYLPCWK